MTVYEQLQSYCECAGELKEKDVDELITIVSMATCWSKSPCDTFMMGDRREVIELPPCTNKCDIFTFKPFYKPYNVESFKFTLVEQKGLEELYRDLEDFMYSEIDEVFKIKLPLNKCMCFCECGCPTKYKLIVEYEAGYEEIPECILPVFCDMIDLIKAKNECDCEACSHCGNANPDNDIDYGTYNAGDILTASIKSELANIMTAQYRKQLEMISLCKADTIWGVIV